MSPSLVFHFTRIAIETLGWAVFPGYCWLCLLPSHRNRDLCIHCEADLPWLHNCCEVCGLPNTASRQIFSPQSALNISGTGNRNISETSNNFISGTGNTYFSTRRFTPKNLCAFCKRTPRLSPISRVVAPFAYSGCAAHLTQQQKHQKGTVAARLLAELLGDTVLKSYHHNPADTMPNLLVPVPLHWRREWQRGHNQSALLALHLSQRLRLPVRLDIARRVRATPSQQQLDIDARSANMHNAFAIKRGLEQKTEPDKQPAQLHNARVAIIDDVVTTGATARALAQVLVQAGATEVHLWTPTRAILSTSQDTTLS